MLCLALDGRYGSGHSRMYQSKAKYSHFWLQPSISALRGNIRPLETPCKRFNRCEVWTEHGKFKQDDEAALQVMIHAGIMCIVIFRKNAADVNLFYISLENFTSAAKTT